MDQQDTLQGAAFIRGRQAGIGLIPASLNPFAPGSAEHLQWQQGHASAEAKAVSCQAEVCPLAAGECKNGCFLRGQSNANARPAREFWERDRGFDMDWVCAGGRQR